MATLSANVQNRWKDSYASSPQVKLTVRANGEEKTQLITPQGLLTRAGFDAPTVAPTCSAGTSGSIASGKFVAYRYVYASSRYPFVDNAVTGGNGMLYPRSNPSPTSSVFTVTSSGAVTVTVTKTTRSDVDMIWVYRAQADTTEEAQALADAGQMFYVGSVGNNGIAGSTTFTDSAATDTSELLEIDNYAAPTCAFVVFDGVQWWGFGNPEFSADVTLDSTSTVTLSGNDRWFDGRDGQVCTFDGISSGGFDARGSFYFKRLTDQTAQMSLDEEGTQPIAVRATGTTKIHVRGPATTIYRSKPRNPFSWGWTEIIYESGSAVRVPQLFAAKVGGGIGTAMAFIADDRRLKVDTEAPAATYTFDLNAAEDFNGFEQSKQTVDGKFSVSSHFSQFLATTPEGPSVLMGLDVKNFSILQSDGDSQIPVSSPVFRTLRSLKQSGRDSHFFHGVYDPRTELNCWWVKTAETHAVDEVISGPNLLIAYHAPTGQWSVSFDPEITASASVYDPTEKQTITLVGSESGHVGRAFSPDVYRNWVGESAHVYDACSDGVTAVQSVGIQMYGDNGGSLDGAWFILTVGGETIGYYIEINSSGVAMPAAVAACTRQVKVHAYDDDGDVELPVNATAQEVASAFYNAQGPGVRVGGNIGAGFITIVSASTTLPLVFGESHVTGVDGTTGFEFTSYSSMLKGSGTVNVVDVWGVLLNSEGKPVYLFYPAAAAGDSTIMIVDRWLAVGGHESTTTSPDVTGPVYYFIGATPVRARRYFDLQQPTKAKKAQELWLTAQNVDVNSDSQNLNQHLTVAWFKEYSDTEFSRFSPTQDKMAGSTTADSVNWLSKTAVPSLLLNQFGVEVSECGYDAFRLQTLHIKTNG